MNRIGWFYSLPNGHRINTAERYERKSMVITTNLVFSEWDRIFKDPMTTMAAIDRVVHHSVVLDLMTIESYRATAAKRTKSAAAKTAVAA